MTTNKKIQTLAAIVILGAGSASFAQQQQPIGIHDPYNPQRSAANGNAPGDAKPVDPNLIDYGFGSEQDLNGPYPTSVDKQFVNLTAYRSMMQIRLGQIAVEKGSTAGVRQIGQKMVDDYSKVSGLLNRASARLKIAVPADLDSKHKSELDKVTANSGAAFDQAYLKEVIHLEDRAVNVTQFEASSRNAGVAGFRNWSSTLVPMIEDHIKTAKQELSGAAIVSRK